MESFNELSLPDFLGKSLQQMNFTQPTPVQAQAIPVALEGKDVIASAQTGTGKTAAFGIPLLSYLEKNPGGFALVLTPTRELAVQVLDVLRRLTGAHPLGGSVLLIGGANMGTQLSALSHKPRLVIGTPGRVIDHLNRGSLSLASTGFLVLDEADRMLDMGFAPQLEEIRKRLTGQRQTLLFSATIPPDIQAMAAHYLKAPVRISVGPSTQPVPQVTQKVLHTTEPKKPEELMSELQERRGSVLVFARTQHRVDRILDRLKEKGIKATRIHGGRSQSQRRQAIDQFREGRYEVLVATDIAARGLDIHHIAHVINYDLPRNPEDYIHRVGRTARAGAQGEALCFLTPEDRDLWRRILKLTGATPQSIQVKPSHFGFTEPKPQPPAHPKQGSRHEASTQGAGSPTQPAHPRHGSRHEASTQGGHRRDNRGRDDFKRRDFHDRGSGHRHPQQGTGSHSEPAHPKHGSRHEASTQGAGSPMQSAHPKHGSRFETSTQGGHRQHPSGHSSQRENFIFHGSEDRQPGQYDREDHRQPKETFLQRLGRKLTGGDQRRPGSRDSSRDHRDFKQGGRQDRHKSHRFDDRKDFHQRDRQERHPNRHFDERQGQGHSGDRGNHSGNRFQGPGQGHSGSGGQRPHHPGKHFRPKGHFKPRP